MPKVLFKAILAKEHVMLNTVELSLIVLDRFLFGEVHGCPTVRGMMITTSVSLVTVESKIDLLLHLFLEHLDLDFVLLMIDFLLTGTDLIHHNVTGSDNLLL